MWAWQVIELHVTPQSWVQITLLNKTNTWTIFTLKLLTKINIEFTNQKHEDIETWNWMKSTYSLAWITSLGKLAMFQILVTSFHKKNHTYWKSRKSLPRRNMFYYNLLVINSLYYINNNFQKGCDLHLKKTTLLFDRYNFIQGHRYYFQNIFIVNYSIRNTNFIRKANVTIRFSPTSPSHHKLNMFLLSLCFNYK